MAVHLHRLITLVNGLCWQYEGSEVWIAHAHMLNKVITPQRPEEVEKNVQREVYVMLTGPGAGCAAEHDLVAHGRAALAAPAQQIAIDASSQARFLFRTWS
jgi:hypothetical protein